MTQGAILMQAHGGETLNVDGEGPKFCSNATATPMEPVAIDLSAGFITEPPTGSTTECTVGLVPAPAEDCVLYIGSQAIGSDRRLKHDISQVGITHNALSLYEFRYRDRVGLYRGVMAQEVLLHTPDTAGKLRCLAGRGGTDIDP